MLPSTSRALSRSSIRCPLALTPLISSSFPVSSFPRRALHITETEKYKSAFKFKAPVVPLKDMPKQPTRAPLQPHHLVLNVESRTQADKYIARYLRNLRDRIPGVIFDQQQPGSKKTDMSLERTDFLAHHRFWEEAIYTRVFELYVDSASEPVLAIIKQIQYHPVTNQILNIAFQTYKDNVQVRLTMPIYFMNEDQNIAVMSDTAELLFLKTETQIYFKGESKDIQPVLGVDVKDLLPGRSLQMQDLILPPGFRLYKPLVRQPIVTCTIGSEDKVDEEEVAPTPAATAAAAAKPGAGAGAAAGGAKPAAGAKAPAAAGGDDKKAEAPAKKK